MADEIPNDDLFDIKSVLQLLLAEMKDAAAGTNEYSKAIGQQIAQEDADRKLKQKEAQERKKREKERLDAENKIKSQLSAMEKELKNFSIKQKLMTAAFGEQASTYSTMFEGLATRIKAVGKALGDGIKIITDGISQAREIGLSAEAGTAIGVESQVESIKTIFTFDANKMFSPKEIQTSVGNVTQALNGFSSGLVPSTSQVAKFRDSLAGANIQGQPTAETFKALAMVGATTASDFNALRAATGRQSISTNTLSGIINRNLTSVSVFGTSMLKRALDFDRLGISLDSLIKGGESYVTNLDGQIDAIAQLGQLGTNIDFEKLTMLQEFDPAKAQEYVASLINSEDLRSSSYRALLGQIGGINVQEILKIKGMGNFENLEKQVATGAKEQEDANKKLSTFAQIIKTITENDLTKFILGLGSAVISLIAFTATLVTQMRILSALRALPPGSPGTGAPGTTPSTSAPPPGMGAKLAGGARAGAGMGVVAGLTAGVIDYQQNKSIGRAFGRSLATFAGTVIGGALGSLIPIPGVGTILGASAGSWAANWLFDKVFSKPMDDGLSYPGYGDRSLITQAGTFPLNNNDTMIAGTNLFGKGSLRLLTDALTAKNTPANQPTAMQSPAQTQARQSPLIISTPGAPPKVITPSVVTSPAAAPQKTPQSQVLMAGVSTVVASQASASPIGNVNVPTTTAIGQSPVADNLRTVQSLLATIAKNTSPEASLAKRDVTKETTSSPSQQLERMTVVATPAAPVQKEIVTSPDNSRQMERIATLSSSATAATKPSPQQTTETPRLMEKLDMLITTIRNASTVINVGTQTQMVPRFQLAKVVSRNELE